MTDDFTYAFRLDPNDPQERPIIEFLEAAKKQRNDRGRPVSVRDVMRSILPPAIDMWEGRPPALPSGGGDMRELLAIAEELKLELGELKSIMGDIEVGQTPRRVSQGHENEIPKEYVNRLRKAMKGGSDQE
jgi:hypothetical protein